MGELPESRCLCGFVDTCYIGGRLSVTTSAQSCVSQTWFGFMLHSTAM